MISSTVACLCPNPSVLIAMALGYTCDFNLNVDLKGFNFKGGMVIRPEFIAMFLALTIYTAAFISETVRSGILSTPIEDLYVIPRDFLEDGRIGLAVSINPLASWLWISGPFFIFGTIFALWPAGRNKNKLISK